MKITANSSNLARALRTAGKVIATKASTPILECFLLETKGTRLIITATNGSITVKLPVPLVSAEEEGRCAIPAKRLTETVNLLPADVDTTLAENGGTAKVSWKKGSTQMQTLNAEDFPTISEPSSDETMDMPAQELLSALTMAIPACSKDELRPQFCGVHFDILEDSTRIVASDMKSLTLDTIDCTTGKPSNFTVPTATASLLKGAIRKESTIVRMTKDSRSVCFNLGDIIIISTMFVGKYPKYMDIIPKEDKMAGTAESDREELIGALRRLAACSPKLKMTLTPLSLLLTAQNTDNSTSAEEDCTCTYNGEEVTIGMTPSRLLETLDSLTSEKVYIKVAGPRNPLVIRTTDETHVRSLSLVMPIAV